ARGSRPLRYRRPCSARPARSTHDPSPSCPSPGFRVPCSSRDTFLDESGDVLVAGVATSGQGWARRGARHPALSSEAGTTIQGREMTTTTRCFWVPPGNDAYAAYHDTEWGFPVADDRRLFEKMSLEGFQSGLSWWTILRKREGFRSAFAG